MDKSLSEILHQVLAPVAPKRKRVRILRKRQRSVKNVTSFQNANAMSTSSPLSEIKLCPFDASFKTNSKYICYKYEKCCPQGCCPGNGFTYYQSWTFWAIIAVIFGIFYLGSWYCKKAELAHKRRVRMTRRSLNPTPQSTPRTRTGEGNADHLLMDYIIHSYRLQNITETPPSRSSGAPPKYQEALSMPRVVRSNVQIVQIHSTGAEVPPTYEDAVQSSRPGEDAIS
ncbi:hypothetical protein NQ315_000151 [Exocentrus adspersus]|uniref:Vesicular, overexpressed in cancer, prosurvival protein 1 n=1 Tax=Exocentrus adspersus TaxID=1586481 RepID=A0AAV8VQL2_9CUCU|nr:hypothetical protein NQ315_000151 [Exocentrus adspersus]